MRQTLFVLLAIAWSGTFSTLQAQDLQETDFNQFITDEELYHFVDTLCCEEFAGRLTGHIGYDLSANWVIAQFREWGIQALGDGASFLQKFPHPYTDVFPDCAVVLHQSPTGGGPVTQYEYVEEFIPGSTSGNGSKTAEVVYCGYGITAPELGYDDYAGVDVRGKIVLIEKEVPLGTGHADFMKWRPYSFHQYKIINAARQGAVGLLYNYQIANPNNAYERDLVYSHVGEKVVNDIFDAANKDHRSVVRIIREELKPQSFHTGQTVTVKNNTKHHPDGIGSNVIGYIEGSDPILKHEYILLGGHLDHLGKCYTTMPGANDNASAVAVTMGVAKAMKESGIRIKRSVVFILLGAEEAAIRGCQYFLKYPSIPLDQIAGYINMDGVGIGNRISAGFGNNYPNFYAYLEKANTQHEITTLSAYRSTNIGRPRLDAAFFDWYGIPVLSLASGGSAEDYANYRYHTPYDNITNINPQIMFDLTELLYYALVDMGNADALPFKRGEIKTQFID